MMNSDLGPEGGLLDHSIHGLNEVQAPDGASVQDTEEVQKKDSNKETSILDESDRLKALAAGVRDQDELERNIGRQV